MRRVIAVITLVSIFLTGQSFAAEWTTPVPVASGINTQYTEATPFLSSDGLSLYFSREYSSGSYFSIYEAKRSQPSGDFTSVNQVLSTSYSHLLHPWVSPDNLRMYYHVESSSWQIKMSQRASVIDPWSGGTAVGGIPIGVNYAAFSADELTAVFSNSVAGNWDLYTATRSSKDSAFGNIHNLSEINSAAGEDSPSLSPDGLSLYFHSDRNGVAQIFEATRLSLNDPFGNLQHLSVFDNPNGTAWPSISSDGRALYFAYGGSNSDIYVSYNVPEPATLALFGLGVLALGKRR